jgi:hypothetical protein
MGSELEVAPFPPSEFNEQNPFAKEILKTGIKLISFEENESIL